MRVRISVRVLVTALVAGVCVVGLLVPVLIDAHHWWPRAWAAVALFGR